MIPISEPALEVHDHVLSNSTATDVETTACTPHIIENLAVQIEPVVQEQTVIQYQNTGRSAVERRRDPSGFMPLQSRTGRQIKPNLQFK